MKNTPETIFLQVGGDCPEDANFKDCHEVTWCVDQQHSNDIEYVRADTEQRVWLVEDAKGSMVMICPTSPSDEIKNQFTVKEFLLRPATNQGDDKAAKLDLGGAGPDVAERMRAQVLYLLESSAKAWDDMATSEADEVVRDRMLARANENRGNIERIRAILSSKTPEAALAGVLESGDKFEHDAFLRLHKVLGLTNELDRLAVLEHAILRVQRLEALPDGGLETIEPCPFCGDEMRQFDPSDEGMPSGGRWNVHCDCGASGPDGKTVAIALAGWNRRTGQQLREADGIAEGIEIIDNLISSVREHGNYSADATVTFLSQARQCFSSVIRSRVPCASDVVAQAGLSEQHPSNKAAQHQAEPSTSRIPEGYMPLVGAVRQIRERLARFAECAEDDEDCDIGRHWFDALTTIGLLARTQRIPARWSMTPAGEELLAASLATLPQAEPTAYAAELAAITSNQRRAVDKALSALEAMAAIWGVEIRINDVAAKLAVKPEPERAAAIAAFIEQAFIEGAYRHYLDRDQAAKTGKQLAEPGADERINAIADGLFKHQRITDKIPPMDRDGFREIIGAAIAEWCAQSLQQAEPGADGYDRETLELVVRCDASFLIHHLKESTAFDTKLLQKMLNMAKVYARAALSSQPNRGTPEQILTERKLTCEAIDGAIALGYQNANQPPSDEHWLAPFWRIGRKQAVLEQSGQRSGVAETAKVLPFAVLDALRFYANGSHFCLADETAWDTVSGEPQNFWCDEAGTATVEDGSIAKAVLQGAAFTDGDNAAAVDGEVYTAEEIAAAPAQHQEGRK
ncbi:hypothetical protein [Ralstonia pseudosolanacearum]|uniref:hypothetical protein n=1 Tax=Ralstonia pseudosolanacearum TaxID=1310165 RepID=UPI003CF81003